ncbi:hypothetical protein D3C86_2099210 [compost metagenome]
MKDLCPIALGDFDGPIRGARVHQDDLVDESLHAGEAVTQEDFLVLGDHAQAQRGHFDLEQRHDGAKFRWKRGVSVSRTLPGLD